jgi:hypothetical protein
MAKPTQRQPRFGCGKVSERSKPAGRIRWLAKRPRQSNRPAGSLIIAAVMAAVAMMLGTASLVSLSLGRSRTSSLISVSGDAKVTAEAGINRIIASLNRPENRGLMVSGLALDSWATATDAQVRSPCESTTGARPGPLGDGRPSTTARSYGDGQFRDFSSNSVNTGTRRFALQAITYATGANGSTNRREIQVSSSAGVSSLSTVGTGSIRALTNLDDPDGTGVLKPGSNSGYLTITVEGRVYRSDGTYSRAVVTREFALIPKCCGTSFGSNGSGGTILGNSADSLGADSRFCQVDFGVISGLNGGSHWTLYANDSYTTRNSSGQIIPLNNIIGDTSGMSGTSANIFSRSNCRVIPCNKSSGTDATYWGWLKSAKPGGVYGTSQDIAGTTISGIPVIAANISLPPVSSYYFSFSSAVSAKTYESFSSNEYLRTNQSTQAVERRFPNTTTGRTNCQSANGNVACSLSDNYYWSKLASCEYTINSPITNAAGFHCKGPSINLSATSGGQSLVIDTSDGPLSLHYNAAAGWTYTNSTQDMILLGSSDAVQHVKCGSRSGSCASPVSDLVFSALGQPAQLNILGNPFNSTYPNYNQHIYLNATTSGSADPGKITGVFIYLPSGFLELNAALGGTCVISNPDCWNVNGRIWVRNMKAYGDLVFRVPPSSGNYVSPDTPFSVVPWMGIDWVARSVTGVRNY